jgi:uncharacterized membrane protein
MTKQQTLQVILVISLVGVLFSGFLTYKELFTGTCSVGFVFCGTKTGLIAGLPACVYGLVMYSIIYVTAIFGVFSKKVK